MNIFDSLRAILHIGRRDPPSSYRNRAGGMAWIRGTQERAINNRIVCTKRLARDGKWVIEPAQELTATIYAVSVSGRVVMPGDRVLCTAVTDDCLVPIRGDLTTKEEVDRLYAPGPVIRTREPHL